jgi:hypothetical protein
MQLATGTYQHSCKKFGEWINDAIDIEMAAIYRLGLRLFWNALKKSSTLGSRWQTLRLF